MKWPLARIGNLVKIRGGGTPKRDHEAYFCGDIPWVTPKDMKTWEIADSQIKITPDALDNSSTKLVPADTVLLVVRSGILKHSAPVAINKRPVAINQDMKSLECGRGLCPTFLGRFLQFSEPIILSWVRATTADNYSTEKIKELEIPLPPLAEQWRIGAILDLADELRQKRRRSIVELRKLEHTIFFEVFGDPVRNSRKWPVVEVGSVTDCIVPGRDKPKSFSGNTPWITTSELVHLGETGLSQAKAGLTDDEIRQVRARVIPAKSVILTCVGDLGVVSIADTPMVINQQLHAYQCSRAVTPEYLMYALSYQVHYMRRMATKTTLPYMNKTICNGIPIQLPPLPAQKIFSARYNALSNLRRTQSGSLDRLDSLFVSLQHRVFNGELASSPTPGEPAELAMAG